MDPLDPVRSSPVKDSSGIIHQLQSTVLKQQRDLDRLRRKVSTTGDVLSLDDGDSVSDIGDDDDDLLFDATLTDDMSTPHYLTPSNAEEKCEISGKSETELTLPQPVVS